VHKAFKVGELDVLVFSDGKATFEDRYIRGVSAEQWEPHRRWLTHDLKLEMAIGVFLVRSGDTRVLIDCGIGPFKGGNFEGGLLMDALAGAHVAPEEIDVLFATHLHADHIGWGAQRIDGAMQPTFPNATYRWTSAEQAYWSGELPPQQVARRDVFAAVAPRFSPADDGAALAPGVNVMALPGHTPGHAGVVLSSGDERAFILGDAISCPVQLEEPEWSGMGDVDAALARRTQEAVARELEGSGALAGAAHFPGLTFGRVLRASGRRYWEPLGEGGTPAAS
jgi:glyoxylase-like metal-dependent hydrolase (beta-lactamase superfamily II)